MFSRDPLSTAPLFWAGKSTENAYKNLIVAKLHSSAARRASIAMPSELVINATLPEIRVALLEDGEISDLSIEYEKNKSIVGNVYKGRIVRVLPGMQAAFVDIGLERAAFLYVGDIVYEAEGDDDEDDRGPRRGGRGEREEPAEEESDAGAAMEGDDQSGEGKDDAS